MDTELNPSNKPERARIEKCEVVWHSAKIENILARPYLFENCSPKIFIFLSVK